MLHSFGNTYRLHRLYRRWYRYVRPVGFRAEKCREVGTHGFIWVEGTAWQVTVVTVVSMY